MALSSFFKSVVTNWVVGWAYRVSGHPPAFEPMDLPPGPVVLRYYDGVVVNAAVLSIETEGDNLLDRPIVAGPGPLILEFSGKWPKTENAENAYITVGDGVGCLLSINGRCIIAGRKLTVE